VDSDFRAVSAGRSSNRAKHKTMKQKSHDGSGPDSPSGDFRPDRVRSLLCSLKRELEQFQGREITYDELGRYAGTAGSTVFEKLLRSQHAQIEALLGWLEHLPPERYCRLLAEACRCLPTISHPRLAHDLVQVSILRNFLKQEKGLTLVFGGSEGVRTFVMTALGHSAKMLGPTHRLACGVDRFLPDWHVPVDGVIYLNISVSTPGLKERALKAWEHTQVGRDRMVLLNGICSVAPELIGQAVSLAKDQAVFIADERATILSALAGLKWRPAQALKVRLEDNERIHVSVEQV
jgi:hypothetical protein